MNHPVATKKIYFGETDKPTLGQITSYQYTSKCVNLHTKLTPCIVRYNYRLFQCVSWY